MSKPPADLCPAHRRIWLGWRNLAYDPRRPKDWPGQPLLDARISHADRRADWDAKNAEQMALTEECCRSGRSAQCDHPPRTDALDAVADAIVAEALGRAGPTPACAVNALALLERIVGVVPREGGAVLSVRPGILGNREEQ